MIQYQAPSGSIDAKMIKRSIITNAKTQRFMRLKKRIPGINNCNSMREKTTKNPYAVKKSDMKNATDMSALSVP